MGSGMEVWVSRGIKGALGYQKNFDMIPRDPSPSGTGRSPQGTEGGVWCLS